MAQKEALDKLWPLYGLDSGAPFRPELIFGRQAPLIVEIGFGNGDNLAANAAKNPQYNYLGIEVHKPGIGHLMTILANLEIDHVRIFQGDAIDILRDKIPDRSIEGINLFFPDPWPKKRHHKRRLVSPYFVDLISGKLEPGGCFHAATDWEDYAHQMTEILEAGAELHNVTDHESSRELIAQRSMTRFEKRGLSLGHQVQDIIFKKHAHPDLLGEVTEAQAGVAGNRFLEASPSGLSSWFASFARRHGLDQTAQYPPQCGDWSTLRSAKFGQIGEQGAIDHTDPTPGALGKI